MLCLLAASRLISRLRKTESSPRPPPAFALPCPPLEMVSLNSIANPDTVVSALTPDLMVLVNYAKYVNIGWVLTLTMCIVHTEC